MLVISNAQGLRDRVGTELGISKWLPVTQAQVDTFADVTGDHAWIHVDVARAQKSKFGGTIVHGYFTLSLVPQLLRSICRFEGFAHGLNYGLNRVRFPAPMPVGGLVRLRAVLDSVEDVADGVIQFVITCAMESNQSNKPVCVAETISRLHEHL